MLAYVLALTIPVTTVALIYARWEYLEYGKLTLMGLLLLSTMFFVPNLILEYATTYEMPSTLLDYFGLFVGFVGLVIRFL